MISGPETPRLRLRRRALLAVVLLAVPDRPARAQIGAQNGPWDLARLMAALRGVRVAEARFEESRRIGLLNQTLRSSGQLSYRAPDRLEKLTTAPQASRVALIGDLLTIEQPDAPARTIALGQMPQIGALVGAVRWTLSGDLPALSAAFVVSLAGDSAGWTLELVPREASVRELVRQVVISGVGVSLRAVRTEQADGDRDDMTILPDPP